jgi:flagellar biosynthesis protein FlhF
MKIKKFIAKTEQAAFELIKREFGQDALILNTKSVKDEAEQPMCEVTAAIEKPDEMPSFQELITTSAPPRTESSTVSQAQFNSLQKELDFMNERMEMLINHIKYENLPHLPRLLQQRVKAFLAAGVDVSLANELVEEVLMNLAGEDLMQAEAVDEKLMGKLKARLGVAGPIKFNQSPPTVVVIVGPTGAGKTTTVAKLAAMYKYTYGKKVALVSADNYRIAAMEQLKAFAEIAKIPFVAAYDNADLLEKVKKIGEMDLILIDTAGLNPLNMKKMVALKETTRVAKADEILLTLSLTTRLDDQKQFIRNFGILNFTGIVFTKLDEATRFGDLLNISVEFSKPIAYLTAGQNIPDDIALADRKDMALSILRGKYGN